MANAFNEFDERLRRIDRNRKRLSKGYVTVVNRDGLMVVKAKRNRRGFPWRGLVLLTASFLLFKALLMAHLGFGVYDDRVDQLRNAGMLEKAGAFVMAPDRVTTFLAIQMRPYLK